MDKQSADLIDALLCKSKIERINDFDETAKSCLYCSIYDHYRRPDNTRMIYTSFDRDITYPDKLSDLIYDLDQKDIAFEYRYVVKDKGNVMMHKRNARGRVYDYDRKHIVFHPVRKTFLLFDKFDIRNECGSCDGTTQTSVHVYEERTLNTLLKYHLVNPLVDKIDETSIDGSTDEPSNDDLEIPLEDQQDNSFDDLHDDD